MRKVVTGEQVAQVYNPDPFALPRWRAPVYRTPFGIILLAKLFKLLGWLIRMIARHPVAASLLGLAAVTWVKLGWVTLAALASAALVVLITWRWFWPVSFSRWVGRPARGKWRAWCYRRRWGAVMTIAGVAPWYQGRILLPLLGKVTATRYVDAAGPAQGRADHPEPVPRSHRHAARRTRAGGHGARRRRPRPRRNLRADLARPGHRRRGGLRPGGSRPGPGAGPRWMGHRCRHPRPGRRVPTRTCRADRLAGGGGMTAVTAWRTDEPCPVCATGLIMHDNGSAPAWVECRLCGWSDTWTSDEAGGGDQ